MSDRDPIRDLENFSLEGDAVHPLPASEVRRRGNRMRRRRTGALAAGAAAAVAMIATSSVVAAQNLTGGDDLQPAPRPSPTETTSEPPIALKEIPHDFPFFDASAGEVTPTQDATLAKQLDYCGDRPLASANPVDALSAEVSGGETSEIRTVLLFGDDAAAEAAEAALLASAAACPDSSSDDVQVTNRVLPVSPNWPGRTIEQKSSAATAPEFASYYFVQTVRAGPALLLTSSVLVGEGIQVDRDAGLEQARSNKDAWVAAMAEFGPVAEPTPGKSFTFGPDEILGGDLKIGMSLKEAKANGAEATDSSDPECVYISIPTEYTGGESGGGVQGYVRRGYGVSTLFTGDAAFKTPEGVGPMSKLSEWRAAYPDGTWDKATTTFSVMAPGRTDRKYTFRPRTEYAQSLMLSDPEHHCNG